MNISIVDDDNRNKENEPSIVVQPYRDFSYQNTCDAWLFYRTTK